MSSKRELRLLTEHRLAVRDTPSSSTMFFVGFLIYFSSCLMRALDRKQSASPSAEASPFKNRRWGAAALLWSKLLLPCHIEVFAFFQYNATVPTMLFIRLLCFHEDLVMMLLGSIFSFFSAEAPPSNFDSSPKVHAAEEGSGSAADHWANLLVPACHNTQKSPPEHIDPPSEGWNFTSLGRKAIHDPNSVESITFRLDIPAESAKSEWQKLKLIGSGAYGNVYKAINRHTGALCAMKEVNIIPDDPKSAERLKQLEQEIRVLSKLKHPNIVQYYGSELTEDRFFIYLEYVYPGSINKYVQEHCGAMTESVVRNFTHHILKGLAYLHSTDNIHRDIKGANLLVDVNGVVKLADFGTAKLLSGAAPAFSFKGTVYWMAPEVLKAKSTNVGYDFAVDIWSLGCTIIEMFTGKHPWSGEEMVAAMFNVLDKDPPIPETLSSEGKDFLQCCLRRNPAERPTASMLLDHPFIRNSNHYNLHGSIQAFAGIKLNEITYSPRDKPRSKSEPSMKGRQSTNGEINHSHAETCESAASRLPPRSEPDIIFPHSNHSLPSPLGSSMNPTNGFHSGSSMNVLNGFHSVVGNQHSSASVAHVSNGTYSFAGNYHLLASPNNFTGGIHSSTTTHHPYELPKPHVKDFKEVLPH